MAAFGPDARIRRARTLAREYPASAEALSFYAELAAFQQTLLRQNPRVIRGTPAVTGASLSGALDWTAAATLVPGLLSWLQHTAHRALADSANELEEAPAARWERLVATCWTADGHDVPDAADTELFVVEALLQPFAEALTTTERSGGEDEALAVEARARGRGARCPACSGRPVVGVLRERGHGARRSLTCGFCLTEWPALRVVCPACGESRFDAISVYRAAGFKGLRVDACDACRVYIKTVDLAEHGSAVPIVDDLGSLPLDLWAQEAGYEKIRPNLLRL